jgi:glycosyltransferase involved in cell wall biosynthesis/tetratricopeptide (TPR) repeat protein
MTNGKRICLNMIVKNEMANLERCLGAVADHIDCWVIGDTGSSDGTQDFIKAFFAVCNLPGELHEFPFDNFEQARNAALDHAYASSLAYDYLLFDDADMELVVEDADFRAQLESPGYRLLQRADSGLAYWNTRLVRRDAGARYHGVTHEYLDVPGDVQGLPSVWYKDHASGSNRVDKFERDIKLLLEALEKDPENHRYWFYLAQSYRDAGRTAEAAVAYAKRAEMGGWDEEAWNARLQEARSLRKLGDDAGFIRQALVAFNQRPQRAEPLYDLARFYREKGMNDASMLFSEAGLAIKRPEQDILFIEDYVYTTGLLEEFAIAANYARDPVRKDRGFAACNWLALNRDVPAGSRNLARSNLYFYVRPASELMPSFTARPVEFQAPKGYRPTNPSVARLGDEIAMVLQTVNFTPSKEGEYTAADGEQIRTRNYLLRLHNDLSTRSSTEILPPLDLPEPASELVLGFEDLRLFAWRGTLWCSSCVRQLTPEGWFEQVLARIDESNATEYRLKDWRVLRPDGPRLHEKNWMPRVDGDKLEFVYRCEPTRIVDKNARTVCSFEPVISADLFSGGSQLVRFENGWLGLIHEVRQGANYAERFYGHRFVWFDHTNRLMRASRPFFLNRKGIEFVAGLAWHPDGKRLLVSYGVASSEAWIAAVDTADVQAMLFDKPAEHCHWASDSKLPADRFGRVSMNGTADEIRQRETAASLFHDSALAAPATAPTQAATSSWVPERPAAGTELMVEGLRERLGEELERISLQVNHPGRDKADVRPCVVWMHHNVDQRWVQWCNDKELVDSVRCFVFVSYWQREQYLTTFGLPPHRCVVLRHALDLSTEPRRWETRSTWRCAYTSTPFRGLSVLLDAWQRLNPANAELHVWSSMKLYLGDDSPYQHLYDRAQSMPGVIYHGLAPNSELRNALRTMHFLVYPCTFAETACLAAIEAMAAGCRIIVPSLGALPETTAGYARVYPSNPNAEEHAVAFSENLADELETPWGGQLGLSLSQQAHCAAVYDWPRRLREWRQLIQWLTR